MFLDSGLFVSGLWNEHENYAFYNSNMEIILINLESHLPSIPLSSLQQFIYYYLTMESLRLLYNCGIWWCSHESKVMKAMKQLSRTKTSHSTDILSEQPISTNGNQEVFLSYIYNKWKSVYFFTDWKFKMWSYNR